MGLNAELFKNYNCKMLMEAILDLEQEKEPILLASVYKKIHQKYDDAMSAYQLAQMVEDTLPFVPGKVPVEIQRYYQKEALKYHRAFLMQEILTEGMDKLKKDSEEALLEVEDKLKNLQRGYGEDGEYSIKKHVIDFTKSFEDEKKFYPTKIPDIDSQIGGGLEAPSLAVIAARPSVGKTAFALTVMFNTMHNVKHLFFSLEMSTDQIIQRLICMNTGIPYTKLGKILMSNKIPKNVLDAQDKIYGSNLVIVDKTDITIPEIIEISSRTKPEVIWVDYLQMMRGAWPGRSFHSREEEVATYSAFWKGLSKEMRTAVVMLAQFNREAAYGKRPALHHLRESGAIEQDIDLGIILHQPNTQTDDRVFFIDKNRNGPVLGQTSIFFDPERMMFGGLEKYYK
jgi:replicative DNA helicase